MPAGRLPAVRSVVAEVVLHGNVPQVVVELVVLIMAQEVVVVRIHPEGVPEPTPVAVAVVVRIIIMETTVVTEVQVL